jgi:hypothetical protein
VTIAEQIKAVESLPGAALREKFREVTGLETRSNNRPYLVKRIAHELQVRAEAVPAPAGAANSAGPALDGKAAPPPGAARAESPRRKRDPRIPRPGTILEREHEGQRIRVKVLEDGFEFRGATYRSLSAVAREATGTTWNGLLFFHLIPYARRERNGA